MAGKTWFFSINLIAAVVSPTGLRQLAEAAFANLVRRIRAGDCPVTVLPGQGAAASGEPGHWHSVPEFFIQLSGVEAFTVSGGVGRLTAGGCMLIPAFIPHAERIDHRAGVFANQW
jgi:hypothetical protein